MQKVIGHAVDGLRSLHVVTGRKATNEFILISHAVDVVPSATGSSRIQS